MIKITQFLLLFLVLRISESLQYELVRGRSKVASYLFKDSVLTVQNPVEMVTVENACEFYHLISLLVSEIMNNGFIILYFWLYKSTLTETKKQTHVPLSLKTLHDMVTEICHSLQL